MVTRICDGDYIITVIAFIALSATWQRMEGYEKCLFWFLFWVFSQVGFDKDIHHLSDTLLEMA